MMIRLSLNLTLAFYALVFGFQAVKAQPGADGFEVSLCPVNALYLANDVSTGDSENEHHYAASHHFNQTYPPKTSSPPSPRVEENTFTVAPPKTPIRGPPELVT